MTKRILNKGDIYYFNFGEDQGSVQKGRRPVIILQDDRFNFKAPTTVVAAITSVNKKACMPSHIDLGEAYGLAKPSMALVEQIRSVNKNDLTDYVGHVDNARVMRQINAAIGKTFGLWVDHNKRHCDIRCLCPDCLKGYMKDPHLIVRRVDPLTDKKEHCDKCEGWGYDYMIYDKRS